MAKKTATDKTAPKKATTTQLWVEIVNGIFKDSKIAERYDYSVYRDNIYMVNQAMAKMYPIEAQSLNLMNINPVDVVRYWSFKLFGTSFSTPSWVYRSPKKEDKPKTYYKYLDEYCLWYKLDKKDVEMDYFLYPEIMENKFKEFKELQEHMEETKIDIKKV